MSQQIAFIGGGNMAIALLGGLLNEGWLPTDIIVLEPSAAQRDRLGQRFGVKTIGAAEASLAEADALVWAVKPQFMREAAQPVTPFTKGALHISIAAGVTIQELKEMFGTGRVVRCMPNLPAVVRAGVTGLCADVSVVPCDRELASRILQSAGHVFWVADERRMNAVTAVSGSGPGYVYHFLEGFQQAAEAMGFPPAQARELVLQVVQGAVELASQDSASYEELRSRVSSKGGTTAAGTAKLDAAATQQAMLAAVQAAYERGVELGASLKPQ